MYVPPTTICPHCKSVVRISLPSCNKHQQFFLYKNDHKSCNKKFIEFTSLPKYTFMYNSALHPLYTNAFYVRHSQQYAHMSYYEKQQELLNQFIQKLNQFHTKFIYESF